MLKEILRKEDCASCHFCCTFRRTSLWETPIFTGENIEAIDSDASRDGSSLRKFSSGDQTYATYDLSDKYLTDSPDEEAPCPYLGEQGCLLNDEEKPWDCKIWPLRVMRKPDGEVVIALTPTCPSINKLDIEAVKAFVRTKLQDDLFAYAASHPYLIKDYKAGFPILAQGANPKKQRFGK